MLMFIVFDAFLGRGEKGFKINNLVVIRDKPLRNGRW